MGLDITAYRKIRIANPGEVKLDSYGYPDDDERAVRMWVNRDFRAQADDIRHEGVYLFEDEFDFRAGSYSGYNEWRDQLAAVAGYAAVAHPSPHRLGEVSFAASVWANPEPGPFVELIHFSDSEGVIGPQTSAKLARDFADFQTEADKHPDEWFRDRYASWRKAFEMAADNGAVAFH